MRIICRVCRKSFERPAQRGRPPTKCPKCRGLRTAQKPAEASGGTRRPASPVRQPAEQSDGLAASISRARACLEWLRGYPEWQTRGYQRARSGVAGVEATRAGHSVRMEWRNGQPITDKAAFKQAIVNVGPVIRKRTRTEPPAARRTASASTAAIDRMERTAEACRELAAWCRDRGWRVEAGWTRRGQTSAAGKVVASRGSRTLTLWFENGEPQSSLAGFRKQVASV